MIVHVCGHRRNWMGRWALAQRSIFLSDLIHKFSQLPLHKLSHSLSWWNTHFHTRGFCDVRTACTAYETCVCVFFCVCHAWLLAAVLGWDKTIFFSFLFYLRLIAIVQITAINHYHKTFQSIIYLLEAVTWTQEDSEPDSKAPNWNTHSCPDKIYELNTLENY